MMSSKRQVADEDFEFDRDPEEVRPTIYRQDREVRFNEAQIADLRENFDKNASVVQRGTKS